jgi:GNAT superfamily N-acetyltransferase
MGITYHAVDLDHWGDFEALFESKGAPKYCWCMAWRPNAKPDAKSRKAAIHKYVQDGTPIGILAYEDEAPIGWCSIGPRPSLRAMGGEGEDDDPAVWSLVCFFIRREHRGEGLSRKLLDHALSYARKHKAKWCEAYPVNPSSPSYRFMGFVELFEAAGFVHKGKAGTRRHVMRLKL